MFFFFFFFFFFTNIPKCNNGCIQMQRWSPYTKLNVFFRNSCITKTCLFKYTENFTTKTETFQIKDSDIFHISAQNIDCGYSLEPPRRGGSNKYPQSMFLSRNKKNNVYPCKPLFTILKWCLRGSKLYKHVFVMEG